MYMEKKLGNNKSLKNVHVNVNEKVVKKYKEGPSTSHNSLNHGYQGWWVHNSVFCAFIKDVLISINALLFRRSHIDITFLFAMHR